MNIKAYIESGVLEAYLMGELDEDEMLEVDRMAAIYPVIKKELEELRRNMRTYAEATDRRPSQKVLERALRAINEEERETFVKILTEDDFDDRQASRKVPLWSIAATILLLISLGFNFFFFSKLDRAESELEAMVLSNQTLAGQIEATNQELDYAALRIAHFLNKDNIHIRMDGTDLSPASFANVFWNKKTNAVFISVDNLPEPPHGHQYQLWAIKPGIAPVDAGIFDHNKLIQELKVIKGQVTAFAVTLEEEGGTLSATVEKTYVKGFLKKS